MAQKKKRISAFSYPVWGLFASYRRFLICVEAEDHSRMRSGIAIAAFFFETGGTKKKANKKEMPVKISPVRGRPKAPPWGTAIFLKKIDQKPSHKGSVRDVRANHALV